MDICRRFYYRSHRVTESGVTESGVRSQDEEEGRKKKKKEEWFSPMTNYKLIGNTL
ncbi:MAG: hypothetical protein HEQ10_19195 [Dolichospermum sp. DEX182a]|nr:hypothetical protein [Dolichospermum sp. DEX182a]QSV63040.1 MAG: hypothetical protein HEQ26_10030 [Dolichospermum sp. DL01]